MSKWMVYLCVFLLTSAWSHVTFAEEPLPRLKASGNKLVDPKGNEVILRGLSLVYLSQKRSLSVNERIDIAADHGANVIRLPLYAPHRSLNPLSANQKYIASAVEHATKRGLYVIIDFHAISDIGKTVPNAHYFWYNIAPIYADQPNVIYELYNEDSYFKGGKGRTWSQFKKHMDPLVEVARSKAPDTLLLVSAPAWSHQLEGILEEPIDDDNIAYVSHLYPGHDRKYWQQAADVKARYPVVVTEFGWQNAGDKVTYTLRGTTSKWGNAFRQFLDEQGMSWTGFTLDNDHLPQMFDEQWQPRGGENYCGEAILSWLKEN